VDKVKEFIKHSKWCLDKTIQPCIANCQLTVEQQREAISIIETQYEQIATLKEQIIIQKGMIGWRDGKMREQLEQIATLKEEGQEGARINNHNVEVLSQQIAALTTELIRWKAVSPDRCNLEYILSLENNSKTLTVENKRLKEALDTIESMATDTTHDIQGIAQTALGKEESHD